MTIRLTSKALAAAAASLMISGSAMAQQAQQGQGQQQPFAQQQQQQPMGQQPWQQPFAQQQQQPMGQMGQQQMGRQQARIPSEFRRVQGRVVSVKPIRVRGVRTPNYIALIETAPGRRVVVDLGQNVRNLDLRPGTVLNLRGRTARVSPNRVVLLADTVRLGDRVIELDRPALVRLQQRRNLERL